MVLRTVSRGQKSSHYSAPAPVKGWNARDAIDDMRPDEAVKLDNFFPGFGEVSLRKGSEEYAADLEGDVFMLAEFNAGATNKFLAAAGGKIWDITTGGSPSALATGFSSDKWQWAQFDDASGGARMGFVNGTDAPQYYNGSTVASLTITGSGLTSSNLDGICIFKSRSYFWDSGTQDFWYSATNALGGSVTKFPLGRVTGFGGNLVAMASWTRDGGDGQDDLACFFMSSGDVVIYSGDNPGDAAAWSLVGIFRLGAPLSARGVKKIGAELVVMTKDGYVALSQVLSAGRGQNAALSDKIRGEVSEVAQNYGSNYGWEMILYPRGNMALFNVPVSSTVYRQHVINTLTGAWCQFKGWNARCFGIFNDRLYFGGSGSVYLADEGTSDSDAPISGDAQTAWDYLGSKTSIKKLNFIRAISKSTGSLSYQIDVGTDFKDPLFAATTTVESDGDAVWDVALWDVSAWSPEELINSLWYSGGGLGYNFSTRLRVQTATQEFSWLSTGYIFERGGLI